MLARRVIPCLDVKDGRVVKGVQFEQLRDAGDPVEAAVAYDQQGADEVCFLDISASHEGRGTLLNMVREVADRLRVPFSVGGGVRSVDDLQALLSAGADKVCINTALVRRPELCAEAAQKTGSQCVVAAVDARRVSPEQPPLAPREAPAWLADHPELALPPIEEMPPGALRFEVYTHGGRRPTGVDAVAWAGWLAALGAGEILLTSMDQDGSRAGYDLELTRAVAGAVPVAVIASGGVGHLDHLRAGGAEGGADAVLAASIFHFGDYTVDEARRYLAAHDLPVRDLPPFDPAPAWLGALRFDAEGRVPVVVQGREGQLQMLAWADGPALAAAARSGLATFYSRSRQRRWVKGGTSGHLLHLEGLRLDCDGDAVIYQVRGDAAACHTGAQSCFYRELDLSTGTWEGSP